MPVYPRATALGASSANASIALYQTRDRFDDVYAWYEKELPAGTPRAYSAAKGQATFALFDANTQRTVHIAAQSSGTMIALTRLIQPQAKPRATGR